MSRLFLPLLILSLGLAPSLSANPYTLQYGGRLVSSWGRPLSGPLSLTVNFYSAVSGSALLATQSFTAVTLQDGIFNLNIELSPTSFETVFASSEVWIEVIDNTNGKIYPRQKFGAVPFAFKVPTDGLTLGYDATGKMRVQGLGPAALPTGNPSDGQILKWKDGTGWEWGADNSGGTAGSVDSAAILDASISNADVAANAAIAGSKINPNFGAQNIATTGTISGDGSGLTNLPAGPLGSSIDGSEIANGSITDAHISASAAIDPSKVSGLSAALAAKEATITVGTAAQYLKGDKSWATLDTAAVPENLNLYYTDARARTALSAAAPLSYNSSTGQFTITAASAVSAGTISAAEYLSFSAKQAAITAASTLNTGTLTTALQTAVAIAPFGTNAGENGELRFLEQTGSGSNYVGFKAPDTIAADKVYVLPAADGSVGQFLSTDGAGNLTWGSVGGAAGGTVTSITAGTGLSGGTITGSGTINLANTAVGAGSYTRANITVDAQGRLTAAANGSSVDLTSDITGILPLANGGTGASTAALARGALSAASSGANSDITSITGLTTALSLAQGGTGATTAPLARTALSAAASGANSDITSITGLTTALSLAQGGTGATTAPLARTALGAAASGANSDITSITGLTTALSLAQGGTGATSAPLARTALSAAVSGANSDITSISGLTTALSLAQGGTGATTAPLARTALSAAASGANSDITSLTGLTTALSLAQGGTGATSATLARAAVGAASSGANSDITSLTGLTTALTVAQGGTGGTTAAAARTALSTAASGANSDITSITGLTTALSIAQGGTGGTTQGTARTALGLGSLATLSAIGSSEITDASIADTDISASAAIDASKIADGTVSSAEFQYINSLTSNAQTQLNAKASAASPTFTGVISSPLGAVGAPSYTFTGDPNTGMWSSAADKLDFSTAGAHRLTIDDSGKVGIGTTAPATKLDVSGTIKSYGLTVQDGSTSGSFIFQAYSVNPALTLKLNDAGAYYPEIRMESETGAMIGSVLGYKNVGLLLDSGAGQSILFRTNGGNEAVRITSAGTVGIGTTAPTDSTLNVVRNSSVTLATDPWSGTAINVENPNQTNGTMSGVLMTTRDSSSTSITTGAVYSVINNHTAGNIAADLALGTTSSSIYSERMRILSNGNVGIGTSNPGEKLEVYGGIVRSKSDSHGWFSSVADSDNVAGGGTIEFIFGATEANGGQSRGFTIKDETNSADRFFISPTGNVGIGTTAPLSLFEVRGGNLAVTAGGGTGAIANSQGTHLGWNQSVQYGETNFINHSGGGTGGFVFTNTNTGNFPTNTRLLTVQGDGKVGIGTSLPNDLLDIKGTQRFTSPASNSLYGTIRHSGVAGNFHLDTYGTGTVYVGWFGGSGMHVGNGSQAYGPVNASAFNVSSDRRLKTDIELLVDPLANLSTLDGYRYHYKSQAQAPLQLGLMAQEVEKVYPEAVSTGEDGFKRINYTGLIAPIIAAINELKKYVDSHMGELRAAADQSDQQADLANDEIASQLEQIKTENIQLKAENAEIKSYLCKQQTDAPFCKR